MTTNDALTCQQVVELVTAYLENTPLPAMRKQVEEHTAACPGCTNSIEQVRLTISMLRQGAQELVFPATKQKLLQHFRNWRRGIRVQEADTE
jgi:predicted anti-sigma-YlaC factor YlaD